MGVPDGRGLARPEPPPPRRREEGRGALATLPAAVEQKSTGARAQPRRSREAIPDAIMCESSLHVTKLTSVNMMAIATASQLSPRRLLRVPESLRRPDWLLGE